MSCDCVCNRDKHSDCDAPLPYCMDLACKQCANIKKLNGSIIR